MNGFDKKNSGPHIRAKITTSGIMLAVIIALMPATGFGIYNFGLNVLYLILVTVAAAIMTEFLANIILKKPATIGDYSALLTGLLLALSLPPGAPLWIGIIGGIFAILIVKVLFGGLGQNIMNPALAARCFLFISYSSIMTNYATDTSSGITSLDAINNGEHVRLLDMFISSNGGSIGESSMAAIIFGAVLLIFLGVIDLKIPGAYLITFLLFIGIFSGSTDPLYLMAHLTSGGVILGAFFMATDYTTRPINISGQYIYGLILGFLTALFKFSGAGFEAVAFAVIIGNLLVPLIEKWSFYPRRARTKQDM